MDLTPSSSPMRTKFDIHLCAPEPEEVAGINYYIYIVDTSLSMRDHDPEGQLRFLPIRDFAQNSQDLTNDRHSLIIYNNIALNSIPFTNIQSFRNQITSYIHNQAWNDNGFSQMTEGLNMARNLITTVVDSYRFSVVKPAINFHIMIGSDGYPTSPNGHIPKQDILSIITNDDHKGIMDLENNSQHNEIVNSVRINSFYFWGNPYDPDENQPRPEDAELAHELMEEIAEIGQGRFVEFGRGQIPNYSHFQSPRAYFENKLIEFALYPMNIIWDDETRQLLPDNDNDGLSDGTEIELSSNPYESDSDFDQVNDLVQLRVTNRVCVHDDCSDASNIVNPLCFQYLQDDGTFSDSDGDGLNDCEEALLESNGFNADSNQNFIMDSILLRYGFNISQSNRLLMDSDGDGLSDRYEIQHGLPHMIHNDLIAENLKKPMKYTMTELPSYQDQRSCFHIIVDDALGMRGIKNNMRVSATFSHPFITNRSTFVEAIIPYAEGQTVIVNHDDFERVGPNTKIKNR